MNATDAFETHRILVVDDSELNRLLTEAALSRLGDVDCVGDGEAALRALDARRYDLILMDLDMPVRDGVQATRAIRDRPGVDADTMVFALSADRSTRVNIAEARLDGFVRRPIGPNDLQKAVRSALSARASGTCVWRRGVFESLANRLGAGRMATFLAGLRRQSQRVLDLATKKARIDHELRHLAHDLCSTSGTMGFEALSHVCRQVLEGSDGDPVPRHLVRELECALLAMSRVLDLPSTAA